MSRMTSCPDVVQLCLFHFKPSAAPEAALIRSHLNQCERCRTILAGFGRAGGNRGMLATDVLPSPRPEMSPAHAAPIGSDSATDIGSDSATDIGSDSATDIGKGERQSPDYALDSLPTISDVRAKFSSGGTRPGTLPGNSDAPPRPEDATMYMPAGISAQETMQLSGPVQPVNGPGVSDTGETLFVPVVQASGQAVAFDSNFPATKLDFPDGPVPKAIGLEGVTVPGYDILEELGRGGMGVVYKARHRRLRRLVALKMVLAGAHVGRAGLARFRAEAEAVAKLVHPNIVQIFETGECEGRPFFSLEFVEGGSLDQQINKSPTTPRGAAQFVEILARTMDVAHQRGIVHRDLKPANILLANLDGSSSAVRGRDSDSATLAADHWSRTTAPKIADFGLVKRTDEESSQTQTGAIMGTPSYMAPEQAGGKTREIGPAVDIYALGAILYEMLVGRPPFKAGNPIDTVRQVIEQDPVPPRQLEPRVPYDLETICLKCLEKDPARRFASAAELADDLRRFVDGDPIEARPTPAWERAWKWGKRRPAIVALLALIPVAIVSVVLFVLWHNVSLRGQLDRALTEERNARQREQEARQENHLSLLRQEGQKLFDSARVAVAARDWATARVDLEKALATIGDAPSLEKVKQPAQALLKEVANELSVEADQRASRARLQQFAVHRDEAQFLGTLYTGMDLAANLEAARAAVKNALEVYGVPESGKGEPRFDEYLTAAQKSDVRADCAQILLILAETLAQGATGLGPKPDEKTRELEQALAVLEQARRSGAPDKAYHLRRGRYLGLLGRGVEAAESERVAQGLASDSVIDNFLIGDELYRREQFAAAIQEFDRVLERKPGHFWAQYLNALCLLRQKRPAEARALLSACLAQRADFVWLYLLRGFAQQELQAYAAADSDFEKAAAMKLEPSARYVLLVNRGVLRIRTGKFDEAVALFRAAIELKPRAYQAFVNLAQAYLRLNQPEQAMAELKHAAGLEPKVAHLHRLQARLYSERNEPDAALAELDNAMALESPASPYQADDQIERGRLLLARGQYEPARGAFDAALAAAPENGLAQRLRAESCFRLGRFDEVVKSLDRYLEKGRPLESVYRGRGLARAELGQYAGAIEDFTKALELHPSSAVQAFRGWSYLVTEAPRLALRDFELAIVLDPKNGDALAGRGFALARLGRFVEAIADAEAATRVGPSSPRLLYNVARIYAQCPGTPPVRAVEVLKRAIELVSPAERKSFWAVHVQKDQALTSLRRHPVYVQLQAQLRQVSVDR